MIENWDKSCDMVLAHEGGFIGLITGIKIGETNGQ
jgi:hypothetical protein